MLTLWRTPRTLEGCYSNERQSRDHRQRQHRHGPDDQGPAHVRAARDGRARRHRSRLRRIGPRAPSRRAGDVRRHRRSRADAGLRRHRDCVRRDVGRRARAPQRGAAQPFEADRRSHAGGHRPVPRSRGQHARARRPAEREPRDVRRPGHDSDRRGDRARRADALRGDRRQHREPIGGPGNPREHRRVHPDDGAGPRAGRRRAEGQSDHRAEPGRPAAHHAEYGLLPRRRAATPPRSSARSNKWRPTCARTCLATT